MKKLLFTSVLAWGMFFWVQAQNCAPTDKFNTIQYFDWTAPGWAWWNPNSPNRPMVFFPANDMVENPYHAYHTDNENIDWLAQKLVKDYRPQDGWELVAKNLGEPINGVLSGTEKPVVVLYNKYTSKLRIFFMITSAFQSQTAMISLRYAVSDDESLKITKNLYAPLQFALPLDGVNYSKAPELTQANRYSNYAGQQKYWLYADFLMDYDPCVCQIASRFMVYVTLVGKTDIKTTINGGLNGTITEEEGAPAESTNSRSVTFGELKNLLQGTVGAGQTAYNELNGYRAQADTFFSQNAQKNQSKKLVKSVSKVGELYSKLSPVVSAVPYVGAVFQGAKFLYSYFNNGGEVVTENKPTVNYLDAKVSLNQNGIQTWSSTNGTFYFNVPGSDLRGQDPKFHPYYRVPLGLMTLSSKPKMVYRDYLPSPAYRGEVSMDYPAQNITVIRQEIVRRGPGSIKKTVEEEARMYFPKVRELVVDELPVPMYNNLQGIRLKQIKGQFVFATQNVFTDAMEFSKLEYTPTYEKRADPLGFFRQFITSIGFNPPKLYTESLHGYLPMASQVTLNRKRLHGFFETGGVDTLLPFVERADRAGLEIVEWPNTNTMDKITYSTRLLPWNYNEKVRFKFFWREGDPMPEVTFKVLAVFERLDENGNPIPNKNIVISQTYNVDVEGEQVASPKYYYTERVLEGSKTLDYSEWVPNPKYGKLTPIHKEYNFYNYRISSIDDYSPWKGVLDKTKWQTQIDKDLLPSKDTVLYAWDAVHVKDGIRLGTPHAKVTLVGQTKRIGAVAAGSNYEFRKPMSINGEGDYSYESNGQDFSPVDDRTIYYLCRAKESYKPIPPKYDLRQEDIEAQVIMGNSVTINEMNLYPNPSSSGLVRLSLQLSKSAMVTVTLIDVLGNTRLQAYKDEQIAAGMHQMPIDVSGLVKGIYICQVETEGVKNTTRLFVR